MLPYPSWKHARSAHLTPSTNQQHAWLRLMVAALETNFFFYESVARAARRFCSRVASRNNRQRRQVVKARHQKAQLSRIGVGKSFTGATQTTIQNSHLLSLLLNPAHKARPYTAGQAFRLRAIARQACG